MGLSRDLAAALIAEHEVSQEEDVFVARVELVGLEGGLHLVEQSRGDQRRVSPVKLSPP